MPQMIVPKSSCGQSDIRARNQALEAQEPGQARFLEEPGPGNAQDNSPIALEYSKNSYSQSLIGELGTPQ